LVTAKNEFFGKIVSAVKLRNPEARAIAVAWGPQARRIAEDQETYDEVVDALDEVRAYERKFSYEALRTLCQDLGIDRYNELFEHAAAIFRSRFSRRKWTQWEQDSFAFGFLSMWRDVLRKSSQPVFIDEGVAGLFSVLYTLLPRYGGTVLNLTVARTDGYFVVTRYGYQDWDVARTAYQSNDFTDAEIAAVAQWRRSFVESKRKPVWFTVERRGGIKWFLKSLRTIPRIGLEMVRYCRYRKNPLVPNVAARHAEALVNVPRRLHKWTVRWDEPRENELYFVMPLHVEPEATLNTLAPYYADQLQMARQMALALPPGHYLYVKEHSAFVGSRPSRRFYQELLRIKGVRLIHPEVEPHDLIAGSQGVITVSSTMAFEAILHGKPILTVAQPFFSFYNHCLSVSDPQGFTSALRRLRDKSESGIEDTEIDRFGAAYWRQLQQGNLYFYRDGNAFTVENIAAVADVVNKEMRIALVHHEPTLGSW